MKFVVVENRNNETVRCCLESAKRANVDLHQITETDAGSDYMQFCSDYVHLSTNSQEFELICFRRYFLLHSWAKANAIVDFVLIDSDVLLFPGVKEHTSIIAENEVFMGSRVEGESEVARMLSPHFSYWTIDSITDFVAYLNRAYRDDEIRRSLLDIQDYFVSRKIPGGVTDMALLYLWSSSRRYHSSTSRIENGMAIDHNITVAHNAKLNEYTTNFGFKRIHFENELPYARTTEGAAVRMVALHFQGRAKMAMRPCLERKSLTIALIAATLQFARNLRLVWYSIKAKN